MVCTSNMNVRTILISAQLSASLEINIWRAALHQSINQSIKDKQPEICCAKFFLQHFWLSLTEENMYCMFTCHTDSWHTGVSLKAGFFFFIASTVNYSFYCSNQRAKASLIHSRGRDADPRSVRTPSVVENVTLFPPWERSRGACSPPAAERHDENNWHNVAWSRITVATVTRKHQ